VTEELEGSNVFIYIAVFHFQLPQFVLYAFMLCIIDKRLLEVGFKSLPSGHLEGELGGVCLNLVEPVIGTLCPSLYFGAVHETQKEG
jgi:hypothetical protein